MTHIADLNIDLLLTIDALLIEKNITHAATRLGISQPAMSARLTRLRHIFGEQLFIPSPHGRGVLPTPRAESLKQQVADVLRGISTLLEPISFDAANSCRTFVIALHENPALVLGPELLNQVRNIAPGIRLRFAVPEMARLPELLENGEIDVCIGICAGAHDAWIRRKLFEDDFVTAQRKGHPRGLGPMDLETFCSAPHLVVSSSGDPFTGFIDQHLAEMGLQRSVVMSTQNYAMAPPVVANTELLCTLPRRMLQRFSDTLDLLTPPLPIPPISIYMFWHPRYNNTASSQWIRAQILSVAELKRDAGPDLRAASALT